MGLSRQEINLRRLLAKCELMCKKDKNNDRLPKYLESIDDMLQEIKKNGDLSTESFLLYQRRIDTVKVELGISTNKYIGENNMESLRDDLFGVRQRNATKNENVADLNEMINYHERQQADITNDMLILTRNLKEQSELANKIVKKDTDVVTRSAQLTDGNYAKLNVESAKLSEHSKRAWKCWMWFMLFLVMVIFISN